MDSFLSLSLSLSLSLFLFLSSLSAIQNVFG